MSYGKPPTSATFTTLDLNDPNWNYTYPTYTYQCSCNCNSNKELLETIKALISLVEKLIANKT